MICLRIPPHVVRNHPGLYQLHMQESGSLQAFCFLSQIRFLTLHPEQVWIPVSPFPATQANLSPADLSRREIPAGVLPFLEFLFLGLPFPEPLFQEPPSAEDLSQQVSLAGVPLFLAALAAQVPLSALLLAQSQVPQLESVLQAFLTVLQE